MPDRQDPWLVVARVARSRGRIGEVLMEIDTDFPEARLRPGPCRLRGPQGQVVEHVVEEVWFHKGRAVVRLKGVAGIGEAEELRGWEWVVPEEEAFELPEGTYYHHELAGLEARSPEGERLGRVLRVEENPGTDLLVLEMDGREVLVPMARGFVKSVQVDEGVVVLERTAELQELVEG